MSRRGKILIAVALAVIAGAVMLWRAYLAPRVFTARHQGKNLEQWAQLFAAASNENAAAQARAGIRALGTNDIPALVAAVGYDVSRRWLRVHSFKPVKLRQWTERHAGWLLEDRGARDTHVAEGALAALGHEAASALPSIQQLAVGTNISVSRQALSVLPHLGTNGLAAWSAIATKGDFQHRLDALVAIYRFPLKTNEVAAVLPVVFEYLGGTNSEIVFVAMCADYPGRRPELVVPVCVNALSQTNADVRGTALMVLSYCGTNAAAAIPAITRALEDEDKEVRKGATNALAEIQGTKRGPASFE